MPWYAPPEGSSSGNGTVTSVDISATSPLEVSGGPITDNGSFSLSLANTSNNWGGLSLVTGSVYKRLSLEASPSGYVDYASTVPSGKRWLVSRMTAHNIGTATATVTLQIKNSGTYYLLNASTSVATGVQQSMVLAGFIYEQGEQIAIQTSNSGLNVYLSCLEFDNTSPLKTVKSFSLQSGDNTLYTCPVNKTAIMLDANMQLAFGGSAGGTVNGVFFYNRSGASRTYTGNYVGSGQSPSINNRCFLSTVADVTRTSIATLTTLSSGDYININASASTTGQMVWAHIAELDT